METWNKNVPRVLIVDDVETNRFILRDVITDMGNYPILAENGLQALKIVQHIKPQLIILDIAMPGMDGFEVCKKIKDNPLTRDIPIIFISAYDEPGDIVKGFEIGCEDYIVKPFIPEVVKARVGAHLKLYEANTKVMEMNRKLQMSVKEQRKLVDMERRRVLYALLRVAKENACYDKLYMERLQCNCRTLAEAMQLSPQFGHLISDYFIDMIELATPLCDLGNLAIHTSVLQKQKPLEKEEKAFIRTHTSIGARILQDIEALGDENGFIHMAEEIAHFHHENWDGTGYPEGVKEDQIPLAAQIVAVVSGYCALTEKRVYRDAYSKEEAIVLMESESGKKYNPQIFWILKKIVRQLQ